jgi:hypothetical protein
VVIHAEKNENRVLFFYLKVQLVFQLNDRKSALGQWVEQDNSKRPKD